MCALYACIYVRLLLYLSLCKVEISVYECMYLRPGIYVISIFAVYECMYVLCIRYIRYDKWIYDEIVFSLYSSIFKSSRVDITILPLIRELADYTIYVIDTAGGDKVSTNVYAYVCMYVCMYVCVCIYDNVSMRPGPYGVVKCVYPSG